MQNLEFVLKHAIKVNEEDSSLTVSRLGEVAFGGVDINSIWRDSTIYSSGQYKHIYT